MNTGDYYRAITWLKRTVTKDATNGQDKETFTDNGTVWGSVQELSASRQLAFGMLNSQAQMIIKVRQYPAIVSTDRLREKRFNKLIVIDGLMHGDNEMIIYCHQINEVT